MRFSDLTAICVDDSPIELDLITRIMMQLGMQVVARERDGMAGWEAIQRLKPNVAVLDIVLPQLSGEEIFHRVRAEGLDTFVVIASSMSQMKRRLAESGNIMFAVKPYDDTITRQDLATALREKFSIEE